jgi:hypothetical protein
MGFLEAVLPGLLVAGVLALLAGALDRWFDPQPRGAYGVYASVIVLLFGKVLFLGAVLLPLQLLWYTPPWTDLPRVTPTALNVQWDLVEEFAGYTAESHRLVGAGEWPLVDRRVGAGEPFLANIQAQNLHPFALIGYLLPPASVPGLMAALKMLFTLVFFGALLRRLGLSDVSALGGTLAYALSGFFMMFLGWPHTHSAAALPMLCYALVRCFSEGGRRDALLLAAGVVLLVLGGHPETVVYALAGAGIFSLGAAVKLRHLDRRVAIARLARTAAGGVLGLALTAPVMAPFLLQLGSSERSVASEVRVGMIRTGEEQHPATAELLLQRSLPIVAPIAFGSERYGDSWGYASIVQEGTSFAGTAALCALALWILLVVRGGPRLPGEIAAFVLLLIGLLFVIQPGGLVRFMVEVPVLSQSGSENRRLSLFVCFAVAYLAACGWERLQRRREPPGLHLLLAPLLVGALVAWAYSVSANPSDPLLQEAPRMAARQLQVGVAGAFALALAYCCHRMHWRERLRACGPVFVLLIGLELYQLHGVLSPPMPRRHYYPPTPVTEFLRENLGSSRMVGLGGAFLNAHPLVPGIADLRSSSPLQPWPLLRLTRRLREGLFSRRIVVADDPILDLLGVRFVVTMPRLQLEPPLERLVGHGLEAEGDLVIWERPRAMNLAFVARTAQGEEGGDWLPQVEAIDDFHRTTLVDALPEPLVGEPGGGGRRWRASNPRENRVLALEDDPSHVRVRLSCTETCLLATSLYQDGGWRVLIDGGRARAARTNGIFAGAWVPAGEHVVDLVYRPPGFLGGTLVCALSLLLGGGWWFWPRRSDGAG